MPHTSVTRNVSRLSGWLKGNASSNMSVTRDASRLSGWFKGDAFSNMFTEGNFPISTYMLTESEIGTEVAKKWLANLA